jgi:arylsulfatase A-like enzyme
LGEDLYGAVAGWRLRGKGARWTQAIGQDIGPAPLGARYAAWLERRHPGGYEEIYKQRRKPEYRRNQTAIVNVLPEQEYVEYWITEEATDFLRRRNGIRQPFFLWIGFCGPHPPFDPPGRYAEMYPVEDMPLPKTFRPDRCKNPEQDIKRLKRVISHYYAMMTCIDDSVGTIIEELERTGKRQNTVIIFTSDHGEMLGDRNRFGKGCFYEPVIRIPTIVYHPAVKHPFGFDGLVETFSLAPTVLDFADIERPVEMAADSLSPVMFAQGKGREFVLSEYVPNDRKSYEVCVRTEQHKLIFRYPNTAGASHELYDLTTDPLEQANRYSDPAFRDQREDLEHLLLARLLETLTPAYDTWLEDLPAALRPDARRRH